MCLRNNDSDFNKIDDCLEEFIVLLNKKGIETKFSCCGHYAERPDVIIANVKSLKKLIKILTPEQTDWIHHIDNHGEKEWHIEFEALVCTPPIYPSWCRSKEDFECVEKSRKDFGFKG